MVLPLLDKRGLLPEGIHQCHFHDIENSFLFSQYRKNLYENFISFTSDPSLAIAKGQKLILGGSFFSDKEFPNDIEATIYAPMDKPEIAIKIIALFELHDYYKETFQVDFYPSIVLPNHNDFGKFFQYIGPKTASMKGLCPTDIRGVVEILEW